MTDLPLVREMTPEERKAMEQATREAHARTAEILQSRPPLYPAIRNRIRDAS